MWEEPWEYRRTAGQTGGPAAGRGFMLFHTQGFCSPAREAQARQFKRRCRAGNVPGVSKGPDQLENSHGVFWELGGKGKP